MSDNEKRLDETVDRLADPTIIWLAAVSPDAEALGQAAVVQYPPDPAAAVNAIAGASPEQWAAAARTYPNGQLIVAGLDLYKDDEWARAKALRKTIVRAGQTALLLTEEGLARLAVNAPWLRALIGDNVFR